MNTAIKFASFVVMAFSLAACATPFQESRRWVEEVKLADGRVINVEREEFLGRRIPLVERNTITFKTEDGKQIRWESCAKPVALDFVESRYLVVGVASFGFCIAKLELPNRGGAAAWVLGANANSRITNQEVPRSIVPNMVYVGAEAAKVGFVAHAAKRGELHTAHVMPWCVQAWVPNGDVSKCSNDESK